MYSNPELNLRVLFGKHVKMFIYLQIVWKYMSYAIHVFFLYIFMSKKQINLFYLYLKEIFHQKILISTSRFFHTGKIIIFKIWILIILDILYNFRFKKMSKYRNIKKCCRPKYNIVWFLKLHPQYKFYACIKKKSFLKYL